jgi:hypothetical protein
MSDRTRPPAASLFYGLLVIAAAQLRISLFTEHFVVSAGIILFALLMLILDEFATLPVVFISATGVMVTRALVSSGSLVDSAQIWAAGMPEFVFYIAYGVIIYLMFRYGKAEGSYVRTFFALIVPDFVANIIEIYIRIGTDAGHAEIILTLLAVAVVRSSIILAIYAALLHYGLPAVRIPRNGITPLGNQKTEAAYIKAAGNISLQHAAEHAEALYQELEHVPASREILDQAQKLAAALKKAAGEAE